MNDVDFAKMAADFKASTEYKKSKGVKRKTSDAMHQMISEGLLFYHGTETIELTRKGLLEHEKQ